MKSSQTLKVQLDCASIIGHNIPKWLYNRKRDRKDGNDYIVWEGV